MPRILLIDDDEKLAAPLGEYFARFDMTLTAESHPQRGLQRLHDETFDLVILDVMMPQIDGFEVCRQIRNSNHTHGELRSDMPIIMLTARGDVTDRVVGLELGADDYLSKPFEPRELVARIQNVLRRTVAKPRSSRLEFRELSIDTATRTVCVGGRELELTTMEYQLLVLLAQSPGQNFTRDEILNVLKGTDAELMTRSVDILVSRLRQKLKPSEPIQTVWGSGYAFVAKSDT